MRIDSKCFISLAILILELSVYGCSVNKDDKGDVTVLNKPVPIIVDNAQTKQFNQQLEDIKDQPSAEKAVNSFVDYVGTRVKPTFGPGASSSAQAIRAFMTPAFIKEVARREVLIRGGATASDADTSEEVVTPLINVGVITDQVNALGADQGLWVDDATVTSVKAAVEGSIPNLNPDGNLGMTPLNAMVVGYALVSGDNGTASAESVNIPSDKMSAFVNTVSQ
jgi:hypothetical protein